MLFEIKKKVALKQPYNITFAKYKLDINEQRILLMIIQALQPEINSCFSESRSKEDKSTHKEHYVPSRNFTIQTTLFEDKIIRIPTRYLMPHGHRNYKRVKDALNSLRKKTITIKSSDGFGSYETYTGFILQAKYYNNNEIVEIQISKELLPHFLLMSQGFTKFFLDVAFSLRSAIAIRIYQKISHWKKQKEMNLYIENYRNYWKLGNKHRNSSQFKQNILMPVQKELKEKADVWFSIKSPIKDGRKVIGWRIVIHEKKNNALINTNSASILVPPPIATYAAGDQHTKLLQTLVEEFKLSERQALSILKKVTEKEISKTLNAIRLIRIGPKGIQTIGGYTWTSFQKKYSIIL